MDDLLKAALELVRAQASVRTITAKDDDEHGQGDRQNP
jgi:hypothetical protein